jgi:O-antigen/teichoic acid export membrane protein
VADGTEPAVVDPERAAETTTGASVARSSAWNLAATMLPQAYLVAVSVAAARFLGPETFGRQSFIAFVEISLVTLVVTGLATAASRFVGAALGANEPGHVIRLQRLSARISWGAALIVTAIMLVIAFVGSGPRAAWIFAAIVAAASVLQRERNAIVTGFQRWREITIVGLAIGAVAAVVVVGVLAMGGGITGIFAVEAAASVALLAATIVLARRALSSLQPAPERGAPIRRMLRYTAIATLGVALTLVVWRRSEFLFLDYYSTDSEIGFYSIAFAAAAAVLLLPLAVSGVLLPSIATLHGAEELPRIRSAYFRTVRLLIVFTLPLIAGGMALGPALIEIVYGSEYSPAGTILVILLIPAPVVVAGNVASVLLAATERLVFPTVISSIAAVINIALSFVLIPRYDSIGAAVANGCAQLVSAAPAIVYVQRRVGGGDWTVHSIVKSAVAATAGGLVAWACVMLLGGIAGFVAGLLAGAAVLAIVARALTVLSSDDAQWLDRAVGGAFRGNVGRAVRFCGPAAPKVL